MEKLFEESDNLKELHDKLMNHLKEYSDVNINSKGKITFYIPENRDMSSWFDDLIETILIKAANSDDEIIKICVNNNINLFEIKPKKY